MLDPFKEHITISFPNLKNSISLVACSGGVDSVLLAYIFHKMGFNFIVCHCNFLLRGKDSHKDEIFVQHFAESLNAKVITKQFDVPKIIAQQKSNIQITARELRYKWFKEITDELNIDYIVTAHHLDDALETFIINTSRGTGTDGLIGIPEENGNIIRPLLPFSKQQIITTAKYYNLKWREDKSNTSTRYLRNRIRKNITPQLKLLNTNFLNNFRTSILNIHQTNQILQHHIQELKNTLFLQEEQNTKIAISSLKKLTPLLGYLYELFKAYGFKDAKTIITLLNSQSGKHIFSDTHILLKDRTHIFLKPKEHKTIDVSYTIKDFSSPINVPIDIRFEKANQISEEINTIFIDKDKIKLPLTLRRWKERDYFYPLGMGGKRKKLSKFFKDEKFSLFQKQEQWLLCCGDDIVWIVNKRQDERFKVSKKTLNIIKIIASKY